jgi:hypothetical protein
VAQGVQASVASADDMTTTQAQVGACRTAQCESGRMSAFDPLRTSGNVSGYAFAKRREQDVMSGNDKRVLAAGAVLILLGLQRMWLHPEEQIKNYLCLAVGALLIAQRAWIIHRRRNRV